MFGFQQLISNKKRRVKQQFLEKQNFLNAIGAIDGTHFAIFSPKVDDPIYPAVAYLNRKGYHSINVQAIFDANIMLLNVNARFPGATHDCGIWETSYIHRHLRKYEEGRHNTWLLGDSGYPLQPWLMTPILMPLLIHQKNITLHVTYTLGMLVREETVYGKGDLDVFFKKDRVLHYNHATAGRIIYSCAVLHNICRRYNIPDVDIDDDDDNVDNDNDQHDNPHQPVNPDVNILAEARIIRLVNQLAHN
ncbi:hypothetical protein NQ314_012761 [Rhamnusium bicolor]|uniref:DDE Tnp4 domain-containing protein n=1 Tax=Rhamnusium bicolor TaxID=1586634 RepID=A0AAV8XA58_9CUCU|nr:hypothetical protein NQ314_012761 [Rhamnusium bicolor]